MTTEKEAAAMPCADNELVITRVFDAPRELVWQAMTDPKHLVQWWGPRGFTTTIQEMDVRPGGAWNLVMHGPDGVDYPNYSVFTEVVKPERIVYSHGGARKGGGPEARFEATWTFDEPEAGKTRLTTRMVFPSAADRDKVVEEYGALEGGKQTFARLAEELAKTPVTLERVFDAPAAMVWRALTDVEQMRQWYFDSLESFKPEVGFETRFDVDGGGKNYPHLWKVTAVTPGEKITYSWKFGGYPGESFLTFELFAEGDKTRLRLSHEGLETFLPEENPPLARGNFVQGWTHIASSLKPFVEEIAPFADRTFFISRTFDAPRELVWKAWTDAAQMARWWGPRDFTNPVCELDARPGGAYRIVMRAPDGAEYPLEGVFREVVEPEKLVMTMDCSGHPEAWHDLVNPDRDRTKKPALDLVQTVTFEKMGDKAKLTIRSRFESAAIRDAMLKVGMTGGWSQSLDRLAACVS